MLIHLKKQKLLPTLSLTIFYLVLDTILASFGFIFILFVLKFFSDTDYLADFVNQEPQFSLMVYAFTLSVIIGIPATLSFLNKNLQNSFFKKYPVIPLFLISMGILGMIGAFMLLGMVFTVFFLPKFYIV